MLDLYGIELTQEERELLLHPSVGGIILFSRNFESSEQLQALTTEIAALREPALLVAVDQEGGRVQRFREGFTRLPPASWFGSLYQTDHGQARSMAERVGWLMAAELRCVGVDFSFAPVLDLGRGVSQVVGDRAFHGDPLVVAELAHAWMRGVHAAGMAAVGKHFPGHGGVPEDSHTALPKDGRTFDELMLDDIRPFARMAGYGLEAVMPAHVIYSRVDRLPAGFSRIWLKDILRGRLGFQGVIFSDDLNMQAADEGGDYAARAALALEAGCDMVLICNNRKAATQVLESLESYSDPTAQLRLVRMHGRHPLTSEAMRLDPRWHDAVHGLAAYDESPVLSLNI
jgi:beta-N-acetylhexosaminidase